MVSAELDVCSPEAVSRSFQYRRVVKPQLERQRRARVGKCLDTLRDLMMEALQDTPGCSLDKLEKADVLELTVCHLRRLGQRRALAIPAQETQQQRFMNGYNMAAQEVARFLQEQQPNMISPRVFTSILSHLGNTTSANVAANLNFSKNISHLSTQLVVDYCPSVSPSVSSSSGHQQQLSSGALDSSVLYTPPASPNTVLLDAADLPSTNSVWRPW